VRIDALRTRPPLRSKSEGRQEGGRREVKAVEDEEARNQGAPKDGKAPEKKASKPKSKKGGKGRKAKEKDRKTEALESQKNTTPRRRRRGPDQALRPRLRQGLRKDSRPPT